MKLNTMFETMELDDQFIAIPVSEKGQTYSGVIKLNDTGAFILKLLKEEVSEEDIVHAISEEYDAPKEQISADVHQFVDAFRMKGFLEE